MHPVHKVILMCRRRGPTPQLWQRWCSCGAAAVYVTYRWCSRLPGEQQTRVCDFLLWIEWFCLTFSSKAKQLIVLSGVLTYFRIFFGGGWGWEGTFSFSLTLSPFSQIVMMGLRKQRSDSLLGLCSADSSETAGVFRWSTFRKEHQLFSASIAALFLFRPAPNIFPRQF